MSARWYPTIDKAKCNECHKCVTLCRQKVLVVEHGMAIVRHPENCVPNCWGCESVCKQHAIVLPISRSEKKMGCNACGRTPCRFGSRGVSSIWVKKALNMCQGMSAARAQELASRG